MCQLKSYFLVLLLSVCTSNVLEAQSTSSAKRALTMDDVYEWQRITHKHISNNGQWIAITTEKWRGDGDRNGILANYLGDALTTIYDAKGNVIKSFSPINAFHFSNSSQYAVIRTRETEKSREARALKKQNKKETSDEAEKAPADTLWIYKLGGHCEQIDSIKSYKLANNADWLAYKLDKDSVLHLRTLDNSKTYSIPFGEDFDFAKEAETFYYTTKVGKKPDTTSLYVVDLAKGFTPQLIKQTVGEIKKMALDEYGTMITFLHANCKKEKAKTQAMSLWYATLDGKSEAVMLVDSVSPAFSDKYEVNSKGQLAFHEAGDRIIFSVVPPKREKDTLTLDANRPEVQVWSWDEPVQYTVQDFNKNRDANKSYAAIVWIGSKNVVQLADQDHDVLMSPNAQGKYVISSNSIPYSNSSMWEGRTRSDYHVINIETGERRELSKADYSRYQVSPSGRYAYGYAETDSVWRTLDLETLEQFTITSPQSFVAWNEENDVPDYPNSYGSAGWLPNDEALLLYDRYDIWKVPARGGEIINLTQNGRENKVQYRLVRFEKRPIKGLLHQNPQIIDPNELQFLSAFNETTKGSEVYRTTFKKPTNPVKIMGGNYMLGTPVKALDADKVIYTKETYEYAPDVYLSDLKFKTPIQISHLADQQKPFIWGTAELVEWTSYKGIKLQGILCKPENFDPNKKYPMIVNFYERNSETLYKYRTPEPGRSTPDYHTYNSNGYIVFNPDVRYVDGHPGESCYDCVMSGIDKVLEMGFVDEKRIGGSGHSWGGYQYAYLATRTDRFAAIESGAPVVNMFSAYGGIRWGSGMARSFQYEHTQSRIGASPWEAPELYTENSSLFNMDKVKTPILIMHNDTDGHVPWYQGIEFFVAMKRLGKPCWMLNYSGEPHWPVRMANRFDFQRRMMQFFDHYLKDAPMPKWMKEGVKAVDQPYELGY
ncbi:MAG: S9 family peptidase [Bacteroidales bacterium]|nr:S9 family peptidase [Bacteroidales bacterium]